MDFPNDPLTVFNCWKTCYKILKQWWATVVFVTQDGAIFHNICGHRSETMLCMRLKICMGDKHYW